MDPISILGSIAFVLAGLDFIAGTLDSINTNISNVRGAKRRLEYFGIKVRHIESQLSVWRMLWAEDEETLWSETVLQIFWGEDKASIEKLLQQIKEDVLWIKDKITPPGEQSSDFHDLNSRQQKDPQSANKTSIIERAGTVARQHFQRFHTLEFIRYVVLFVVRSSELIERVREVEGKVNTLREFSRDSFLQHHPSSIEHFNRQEIAGFRDKINISRAVRSLARGSHNYCMITTYQIEPGTPSVEIILDGNVDELHLEFHVLDYQRGMRASLIVDKSTVEAWTPGLDERIDRVLIHRPMGCAKFTPGSQPTSVARYLAMSARETRPLHRLRLADAAARLAASCGLLSGSKWFETICSCGVQLTGEQEDEKIYSLRAVQHIDLCTCRTAQFCRLVPLGCNLFFRLGVLLCEFVSVHPLSMLNLPNTGRMLTEEPSFELRAWRTAALASVQEKTGPSRIWTRAVRHCFDLSDRSTEHLEHPREITRYIHSVVHAYVYFDELICPLSLTENRLSQYRDILKTTVDLHQLRAERKAALAGSSAFSARSAHNVQTSAVPEHASTELLPSDDREEAMGHDQRPALDDQIPVLSPGNSEVHAMTTNERGYSQTMQWRSATAQRQQS